MLSDAKITRPNINATQAALELENNKPMIRKMHKNKQNMNRDLILSFQKCRVVIIFIGKTKALMPAAMLA